MNKDDYRLDALSVAITSSNLPGSIKDQLTDDLEYAQHINGTEDPALQGIKKLVILGIRRELTTHKAIADAISNHVDECPLKADVRSAKSRGVLPVISWYAEILKPFRWPLAIICFSPHAADVLSKVVQIFR
jgi:hypothetical protein